MKTHNPSFALFHRHHIIPTANKLFPPPSLTTSTTKAKCVLSQFITIYVLSARCQQCCQTIPNVSSSGGQMKNYFISTLWLLTSGFGMLSSCISQHVWVFAARSTFRVDFRMINLTRQKKTIRTELSTSKQTKRATATSTVAKKHYLFSNLITGKSVVMFCAGMTFCTCVIVRSEHQQKKDL